MKFQNPILIFEGKDAWTDEPKVICPFNYFKVGGIKIATEMCHGSTSMVVLVKT